MTEPMSADILAAIRERACREYDADVLADDVKSLLAEVERVGRERDWFQRKATEAGTIAWWATGRDHTCEGSRTFIDRDRLLRRVGTTTVGCTLHAGHNGAHENRATAIRWKQP